MAFRFTLDADQSMESPAINMPTNHNRQNPRTHHTMIVSTVNIGLPSDGASVRLGSNPYKANKMKPATLSDSPPSGWGCRYAVPAGP
jgi:hypothetical protein